MPKFIYIILIAFIISLLLFTYIVLLLQQLIGPHKKGSPELGRMRELAFAIRAKTGWGKVEK